MYRPTKGASHNLVHQLCLALRQASKAQPQASACTRCSKNARVTHFGAGLRHFLPGPTCPCPSLRAVTLHVAHFATQVTLATEPFSSSSSSSTQFHRSIPTISTLATVAFTVVLRASRRVLQRPLPGPRKPHSAVSAVSKCHGVTNIARVPQHHMPLHVLLQPTQICQQQIMGAHEVAVPPT